MKFGDSFIGQPVYYTLDKEEPLGYITGIFRKEDGKIYVNVNIGEISNTIILIDLLEPCKGIF